jgi:hypothetical protein
MLALFRGAQHTGLAVCRSASRTRQFTVRAARHSPRQTGDRRSPNAEQLIVASRRRHIFAAIRAKRTPAGWAEIRTDAGTSSALHRARSNTAHTPPHHRFGDTRRVCPPLPWPRSHAQPRRVCGDVTGTRQTARREPRESVEPNPPGHNSRQRHIPHPPQLLAIPSAPSRAAPTCPTRQPPRTYCNTRLLPTTSGAHRLRPFSVLMVVGTPTRNHRRRTHPTHHQQHSQHCVHHRLPKLLYVLSPTPVVPG